MKIHDSDAKSKGWISVAEQLPELYVDVQIASVKLHDWNLEKVMYEGVGSLRFVSPKPIFSINGKTVEKEMAFAYPVTHWKPLAEKHKTEQLYCHHNGKYTLKEDGTCCKCHLPLAEKGGANVTR